MWLRQIAVIASFVVFSSFAAPANAEDAKAEETFEYVIQPGDTCAAIAERLFGNKRRWDVIHAHNPGMGPTPHRLIPGETLTLPRLQQGPDAELTDVRRNVQARAPKDPTWERAEKGKDLYRGWRVNTLERASADVTFQDGSLVQMRQNTLIIIYGGVYRDARRKTAEASLERGTLRSRLSEFRLDVMTPTAEAGLEGGSSVVSVEDDGTSLLSNHEGGDARFRVKQGKAISVKPGYGSRARRGDRKPSKPAPLPPTPSWLSDDAQMFTGLESEGGTVRGAWGPVEGAVSYRIEVAQDLEGGQVAVSTTAPASATSFEIHRLPAGSYYVRVSAVDAGGFESPQSTPQSMHVHLLRLEEPGRDPSESETRDLGDSAQPPSLARVLTGTRVVAPQGFRCGVGAEASEAFVLREAGDFEVTCAGDDGARAPAIRVSAVAPVIEVVKPDPVPPIVRDSDPQTFVLRVQSELPLPDETRFRAPGGVTLEEVSTIGETRTLTLAAADESPEELSLELVAPAGDRDAVLAEARLTVVDSEELDFAPNEALGLVLSPSLQALMNDRREGSGPFASVTYSEGPRSKAGRWRVQLGGEIAPVRRVRLGIAVPVEVHRDSNLQSGVRDDGILIWGGYRIFMRRDFSLYTELGLWIPSAQEDRSILRTRFAPAIEGSYLLADRLLFRSRQGAILETSSGGPFLWTSAYGIDIKIVRLLAISGELDVSLGKSGETKVTGVGGGPGLSILAGPAAIYFAARFAATSDFESINGKYTLTGGLRLLFN